MRKEPTFCDATTGFSAKWRLGNKRRSSILTSHLIGNAAWELCFNQSEVLPSSRKCHFISMEFLRSFLRRREMLAVSQSNCGIKVILMLVWLCYNCFFFFTERMHSVVVRYYHVHTKSTENVPSLWYKTACKSSRLLTYSLFVTNKLSGG